MHFSIRYMENSLEEPKKRISSILILGLGVVVVLAVLGVYMLWNRSSKPSTTERQFVPPVYKKVAAEATTDIAILIKKDAGGMFFEWNGVRLSTTQRITGLVPGTQYTCTITNNTNVKEGVFIPVLTKNLVINPGQAQTVSVSFSRPGTYYFLGNIYQTGWAGLESGFDVGQ